MAAVIALIGDLIASKRVAQRGALQKRLEKALTDVSNGHSGLASPYTLTLGDEFQAVYRKPDAVVADLLRILAAIHPQRARFALGVGPLSTDINPRQALGMDGPAFHQARAGMETMKRLGTVLRVEGAKDSDWSAINHILAYVGHQMEGWGANRLLILRSRLLGVPVATMATELGISRVAVHKNISTAGLDHVVAICEDLTRALRTHLADA